MPKRYGHIIERIADMENLRAADEEARKGKKANRQIRRHDDHRDENLTELRRMILELDFPDSGITVTRMKADSGKVREIAKQPYFPYRILHHAIMRVIAPVIYHNLINDTFSCVPGKGLHFGVRRMKMMLRRHPEYRWFWKTDYKKFYQSIPHDMITAALERKFKDRRFIALMRLLLGQYDCGDGIREELEDEQRRKARNDHRRVHEPAARQLRVEWHRPLDEGARESEVLPAQLRRHGWPREDEGGGEATDGGVHASFGGFRSCGEGVRLLCATG